MTPFRITVRDLIEQLQQVDPDAKVQVEIKRSDSSTGEEWQELEPLSRLEVRSGCDRCLVLS